MQSHTNVRAADPEDARDLITGKSLDIAHLDDDTLCLGKRPDRARDLGQRFLPEKLRLGQIAPRCGWYPPGARVAAVASLEARRVDGRRVPKIREARKH